MITMAARNQSAVFLHRALGALCLVALPLLAAGCAWMPFVDGKGAEGDEDAAETSEQALYRLAQSGLRSGNYSQSIVRLQRLEARFPFGRYAEQAQLELIYAHHMVRDLDAANAAADRFIRLHPQHPNVDYAFYMKGLTALARDRTSFSRIGGSGVSRRDVSNVHKAFVEFSELTSRYPNSEYAKDAHQRMIHLRNALAQAEINVALYYLGRQAHVAAANRARHVIEHYSRTPAAADALAILIETNWKLGLTDAAEDALQVLALNFPDYRAFDEDGRLVLRNAIEQRERSWVNLLTFGLLDRPTPPPPLLFPRVDSSTARDQLR